MKTSDYSEIPPEVLARVKRRLFFLGLFVIVLSVANVVGGAAMSPYGIQTGDIIAGLVVGVIVGSCIFAGWRIGLKRLAQIYREKKDRPSGDSGA
ncbi:hypothetical protein [Arenimonas oryziterrae]|uniref:hypothetical protein n=1 Tax=Arenimonas oryziterrae TaxID=498055 RepID=UPI0012DC4258|nr:hypothetical protein [Arenimonas oryziterrae]